MVWYSVLSGLSSSQKSSEATDRFVVAQSNSKLSIKSNIKVERFLYKNQLAF